MQHFDFTHCATSRGLLSNIFAAAEEEEVAGRRSPASLIFGMALSTVAAAVAAGEVRGSALLTSFTGDGVRERSELAMDEQSAPVDIGSGEDGIEGVSAAAAAATAAVFEHLGSAVAEDEEGGGGVFAAAATAL